MPHSLAQIHIHLVFSTKQRQPLIDDTLRPDLHEYMAGILRDLKAPAHIINTMPDHSHVLFRLPRTRTLADIVKELKRGSSIWLHQDRGVADFSWQIGYGAFSISASRLDAVKQYIRHQEEHHGKQTFQDEMRSWLREYEVEYDERYLWN